MTGAGTHRRREIAERARPVACPYCGSADTERTAEFGPFHMTEQYHCRGCLSPFSFVRWEEDAPPSDTAPPPSTAPPSGTAPPPSAAPRNGPPGADSKS